MKSASLKVLVRNDLVCKNPKGNFKQWTSALILLQDPRLPEAALIFATCSERSRVQIARYVYIVAQPARRNTLVCGAKFVV